MQDKISSISIKNPSYKNITLQNLIIQKSIYKNGEFSDVKLVRIEQSQENPTCVLTEEVKNKKYALKIISKQRINKITDNYQREYQYIFNQISALYLIQHPNIIQIYWHFQNQQNIYILTQYAGTNLYKFIKKNQLDQDTIKHIFQQICQGVSEIHSKIIIHRQLCLQNIVINSETNHVKIIDFGIAIQFTGGRTTSLGMLTIMAPQVYKQNKYNNKADIWSLGIVLFELFHKRNPFINEDEQYTEEEFVQKREKLQYQIDQTKVSQQAKKLISKMLSINPQHRPTIQQILSSKWITGNQGIISQKLIHLNYLAEQDQKTKQLANRRSLFASSHNLQPNMDALDIKKQKHSSNQFDQQDDFYFQKIIHKMTINNTLPQLQQRLRKLIKLRANELVKKKQLTLQLLSIQKQKIRKDIQSIRK